MINVLVIRHARAPILRSCFPLSPQSFVPAVRNRSDLDGFRLLSWKFRSRVPISLFPLFCDIVPASLVPDVHASLNDRARGDDDDVRKMRDKITASSGRFVASSAIKYPRLQSWNLCRIFPLSQFPSEIESRAKLDATEGPGTPATRKSGLSIFDEATKHDAMLIDMQDD